MKIIFHTQIRRCHLQRKFYPYLIHLNVLRSWSIHPVLLYKKNFFHFSYATRTPRNVQVLSNTYLRIHVRLCLVILFLSASAHIAARFLCKTTACSSITNFFCWQGVTARNRRRNRYHPGPRCNYHFSETNVGQRQRFFSRFHSPALRRS